MPKCLDTAAPDRTFFRGSQQRSRCLRVLAVFIVALVRTVSAARFGSDSMLDATSQGLLDFLARLHVEGDDPSAGELLNLSTKAFHTYYAPHLDTIMGNIILLFTGDREYDKSTQSGKTKCTAVYRDGLCFYLEGLVSMTTRAESLRRVHVLPGRIAWARSVYPREYDSVVDINLSGATPPPLEMCRPWQGLRKKAQGSRTRP